MSTRTKATGRIPGQMGDKKLEEMTATEQAHTLYRGATVSDLEVLFRMDRRTIMSRIDSVKPVGKRRSADIYLIRDVAPYLVKPAGDMADFIKRARPQDLPPLLQKEFWNGQRARQTFLENEGKLWRTDRVIEVFAEAFKSLRTSLMLIPDELERKTTLSDRQRDEVTILVDGMLTRLRETLVDQFDGEPTPNDGPGTGYDDNRAERDDTFDDDDANGPPPAEHDDVFDDEPPHEPPPHDDTFD